MADKTEHHYKHAPEASGLVNVDNQHGEFVIKIGKKTAKRILLVLSSIAALTGAASGGYIAGKSALSAEISKCSEDLKRALLEAKKTEKVAPSRFDSGNHEIGRPGSKYREIQRRIEAEKETEATGKSDENKAKAETTTPTEKAAAETATQVGGGGGKARDMQERLRKEAEEKTKAKAGEKVPAVEDEYAPPLADKGASVKKTCYFKGS